MNADPARTDRRPNDFGGLLSPPLEPVSPKDVIAWWESRRLAYNLLVGVVAFVSFWVFLICIATSGVLQPGEDAIEPIALMAAPLAIIPINICYTLGWLVDAPLRRLIPTLSPQFTLRLFVYGCLF